MTRNLTGPGVTAPGRDYTLLSGHRQREDDFVAPRGHRVLTTHDDGLCSCYG